MIRTETLRSAGMALLFGLFAGLATAEDISLFIHSPDDQGIIRSPNVMIAIDNSANWGSVLYGQGNDAVRSREVIHQALLDFLTDPVIRGEYRVGLMTYSHGSIQGGKVVSRVEDITADTQIRFAEVLLNDPNPSDPGYPIRRWEPETEYTVGDYILPPTLTGHFYVVSAAYDTAGNSHNLKGASSAESGATPPGTWPTAGETVRNGMIDLMYAGELKDLFAIQQANNSPMAQTLYEAWLYFTGQAPRAGTQDDASKGLHDLGAIGTDGKYIKPVPELGTDEAFCGNDHIIFIGAGSPAENDNVAGQLLTAVDGRLESDPIPLNPSNYQGNWADEFARFLRWEGITTHTIDVYSGDREGMNNPTLGARVFLESMSQQGRGTYHVASNVEELKRGLGSILEKIQAVNSVFAAATLPVSINVRGTNLNQVYMGVFRPDDQALPRWMGNLKLYQLGRDTGTGDVYLADAEGRRAQNLITGFIEDDAVSFWTRSSAYWGGDAPSDLPDGPVVEKGGTAQLLRERTTGRTIYTSSGTTLTPFNATSTGLSQTVVDWFYGDDVQNEHQGTGHPRPSIHGDVLHSRPAVVNYGDETGDNVVAFYGANDGLFRAVKGGLGLGENNNAGTELWAFIPGEFLDEFTVVKGAGDEEEEIQTNKIQLLYDNDVEVVRDTQTSPGSYGTYKKPYFVDGSIGVYNAREWGNATTESNPIHLFLSMRRGGRLLYALDVTNPESPSILWKRDNTSTGYGKLGQTWSEPKVARIRNGENDQMVLIFGAGYDPAADDYGETRTMGNAIYVVDASNGNVIKELTHASMASVPSDVTVLDTTFDGYADRLYVGDTGGNIWRADIGDTTVSNWTVHHFASLGGTGAADDRRFLYPPDVVYEDGYAALLIGSGNREAPFETTVANRFYMLKDRDAVHETDWSPLTESDLVDTTNIDEADETSGESTEEIPIEVQIDEAEGWYFRLATGEKVVGGALTLNNAVFFNTNQPGRLESTDPCAPSLGIARGYMVDFRTSRGYGRRYQILPGGGFAPSPVGAVIEFTHTEDGVTQTITEIVSISGTEVTRAPQSQIDRRQRTFWMKRGIDDQ